MKLKFLAHAAGVALAVCAGALNVHAANPLNLLPTPKQLKVEGGQIPLTADARIVAVDPKLKPLAEILSDEILLVTKLKLAVAEGEPKGGDIVLKIDPKIKAAADILTVR